MTEPFRPRAEDEEDIRTAAAESLQAGQQQIEAQQDTSSLSTREQQWNLNEEKRRAYEDNVRAAEQRRQNPGISPEAWTAAAAKLDGEDKSSAILAARQASADIAADDRLLENADIRRAQNELDSRAERERLDAAQQAADVRAHRAAGGATHTDPATGRSAITRHDDGAPAFEAGPVSEPRVEQARTPTDFSAALFGSAQDGAAGAAGGIQSKAMGVRDFRDDRGNIATLPIEEKTDPATGETYVETKDQFGRPKRLTTGSDQKIKRTLQLDAEYDSLAVTRGNLELQAQQIAPNYQAAADAFEAAKRKYDVAPKYIQVAGKWVENGVIPTDPAEQRKWVQTQMPADPVKLAAWQRERQMDRQQYEIAKRNHEKSAPAWDNLQKQIAAAKKREDQIRLTKKRIALGLPEDDGGLAEQLVALDDGTVTTREQAVATYLADLPTDTRARIARGLDPKLTQDDAATPIAAGAETDVPAIPDTDAATVDLFRSAFSAIPGADSLTIGGTGKNYRELKRDGRTIGTIYTDPENPEVPYIAINQYQGSDLGPLVDLDAAEGLRVYLQEDIMDRPSPTKETAWAAGVYQGLQDPAIKEDQQAMAAFLRDQKALPTDIIREVRRGKLSVQVGTRMLRDLHGIEMATGDYDDPAQFQQWIQQTSERSIRDGASPRDTVAAKWQRATKDRVSLSEQQQIRDDYAVDYVLRNPLLTRAQQKALYASNKQADATTSERIRSFVNATKKFAAEDVLGSSLGIVTGAVEDAVYGGAALLSESARETLAQKMRLRGTSTAAWAQGVERFAKTLATADGRKASSDRDVAMREWQRAIDRNHDAPVPDQAAEDAAAQKAIAATLALHNLARDDGNPIEAHHLDPAQDKAIRMAMDRYRATADPRAWALLDERMLMSNDRRWVSAEIEELAGGHGGFLGAVDRARYAGFEEVGSEALSWLTVGAFGAATKGGKALNAAMKGSRAYQASRIGKVAGSINTALQKAAVSFDELGKAAGTLGKPLTTGQRVGNAMLRGGKVAAIGGATEGAEEVFVELGADDPQLLKTFALGAAGGVMMLPIGMAQEALGGAVATHQQQARLHQQYASYAREYNRINADIPGFESIDAKTAEFASLFVNPQEREAGLQQLGTEMETLQELLAAENSAQAAGQTPGPEVAAMEQRLQSLEAISTSLAEMDIAAIDAVSGFAALEPQEKVNLIAYAKAAAGRADLLTTQERKAIQAANTAAGAPVFQGDTVTPEGMAMLVEQYPVLGKLPQFQQVAAQPAEQAQPAPAENVADTANVQRLPGTPEQQQKAGTIAQELMAEIAAEMPAIAQRVSIGAPSLRVSGGVAASIDAAGQSRIQIIPEDIAHSIATGMTPEQAKARVKDNIVLHETIHALQFQVVAQQAASAGDPSTPDAAAQTFYRGMHAQMAAEAPQMLEQGRALYGEQDDGTAPNWDTLPEWAQAAEVVRMLTEAQIAGRTTDVSRLLDGASPSLLQKLAQIVRDMITAITTGQVPESVKQHVDTLTDLYNQLTNAAPDANPSRPDPANRPVQPAASQPSDRTGTPPESQRNRQPDDDGRAEPPPGDDAGAPSEAEQVAQRIVREEFDKALEARPLLKKDADLMSGLRVAAIDIRDAYAGRPDAEIRDAAARAIGAYLQSPEVVARLQQIYAEQSAKARQYREAAAARVREEARRVIAQRMPTVQDMGSIGRISRPTNALELYRTGQTLPPEWDGMLRSSDYAGGGKNAVARAIISMIYAPDEASGSTPDGIASGLEAEFPEKYAGMTPDMLWQALEKELRGYVNSAETSTLDDPDADISGMTDAEIDALSARHAKEAIVEKWRGITNRPVLPATAEAYEAEYQRIVAEEGENEFLDEDYQQRAIATVDERNQPKPQIETREALDNAETEGSQAPLNERVAGFQSMFDTLDPAPLTAIQRNIPGITVPHDTGKEASIIGHAVALGQNGKKPGMLPPFQGQKGDMIKHVVAAALRYWTPAQRDMVTDVYDMFAGGGAWGTLLAKTLFPNVRRVHVNEFDQVRSIKVRRQIESGHRFAEVIQTPEMQAIIRSIIEDYAAEAKGKTWGAMDKAFTAWADANVERIDDDIIAIITMLADTPTRGAPWESKGEERTVPTAAQVTNWFLGNQAVTANIIHQQAEAMRQKGVEFKFYNGDAYKMEVAKGPSSFAIADPPYIFTTGYGGEGIVGPDTYAKTAGLMERLKAQDNHIIYTDEAWWIKPELDAKVTDGAMADAAAISARIASAIDFTVVSNKIGKRRYETLGLHNPAGSPVAAGSLPNPVRNEGAENGRNNDESGRGGNGQGRAGDVAPGTVGEAGIQPAGDEAGGVADMPSWLASAPATGMNGRPAIQTSDGRTLEAPGTVTLMSPAYHGTPHKVDKFRLDKIGTGEGAQAYGWGLYFAEDERIAAHYKNRLGTTSRAYVKIDGKRATPAMAKKMWESHPDEGIRRSASEMSRHLTSIYLPERIDDRIRYHRETAAQFQQGLQERLNQPPTTISSWTPEMYQDRIDGHNAAIERLQRFKSLVEFVPEKKNAYLYKVDLKPAEDEYLDWDKPLSEQSEKVLAAIRRIPADLAIDLLDVPGFYKNEAVVWARKMGWIDAGITNPEGASKYLHALGIRGIRYLDGNSRSIGAGKYNVRWEGNDPVNGDRAEVYEKATGKVVGIFDTFREADAWVLANQESSYNYVIFDEADIEIIEENGQPVEASALFSAPATAPDMRPLTQDRLWGEWAASTTETGILTGYRGEKGNGKADNGFGSSEGVGLYLAKNKGDSEFFGQSRAVNFPQPKRPIIVDEDAGVEAIPMLDEESPVWSRIFSHQPRPGDSDWIKAHTLAAKQIGLTKETWQDKIDDYPRALTDKLLAMGYDAVYVRSGGMEWVNLLAKPGQRFNRGTRSAGGTALYSAPASNPSAEYRYLKAKQEKAGLTPAEEQALLRAEQAMGQSMAFDMDDPALRARKGSVSPSFQPSLNLQTQHPITGQQLALFSPAADNPHFAELSELEMTDWPFSATYNGEQVEVLGPAADFDPNVLKGILPPDTTPDRFRWWRIETKDGKKQNVSVHRLTKHGRPLLPRRQAQPGVTELPSRSLFSPAASRITPQQDADPFDTNYPFPISGAIRKRVFSRADTDGALTVVLRNYHTDEIYTGNTHAEAFVKAEENLDEGTFESGFLDRKGSYFRKYADNGANMANLWRSQPEFTEAQKKAIADLEDSGDYFETAKSVRDLKRSFRVGGPDEIRFETPVVTPQQDAEYLAAVESREMETAQRMVDAAAEYSPFSRELWHGTNETRYEEGRSTEGDTSAREKLQVIAEQYGIKEWSSVANIFERWVDYGMASENGITVKDAVEARRLYEASKGISERGREVIGFEVFDMPSSGMELGVHLGTEQQAEAFGEVFRFKVSISNPLRLPDLGTWNYQSVMREARKRGVDISGAEYDAVFNARDENQALRDLLIRKGYDGVVYLNEAEGDGDSYIVFSPNQIKSADPVTRDADGNVIPLSQRFNPDSDSILYSPATQPDDQAALEAALRGLDPIYGDVLKASQESPSPSPEALAARFNIPVRAVHNIIGTVRTRIQAQGRTIRPGGLQPQRTDDGRLKGGMPKRANSTIPHLAAVDQLQQQEGLPLSKSNREIHDAGRRLASRPDALDHLLAAQRSGAPTAEQIAATAHYLREASVRGDQSAKLTELAILYREQGTRQSEEFRARIDQYHTPSERNALIFQEMLTAPNKKVRKAYDDAKTPEAKLAVLEAWNAKVRGVKDAMKARGIDLDAALARLAEQRANVQAGETYASDAHQKLVDSLNAQVEQLRQQLAAAQDDAAKAAAQAKLDTAEQNAAKAAELDPRNTIRLELEKLRPDERAAIEHLRETQDWAATAARAFMDIRDVKRLVDRFQDAIATAGMQAILLAEDILLDRQAALQAPAANAPDRVKEAYRLAMAMTKVSTGIDPDAINRKAAGKSPKGTRQKKAAGPEPAMMTDEQFAAYQSNPQTWRPLWQAEAALTGQRITFEEWQDKPETKAIRELQERMFKQPVSTFTGELDMQDPISVKRAYDALNIHNASLFDKAVEFWRTSILSGLQTAIVNFGGNIAHSLYQLGPRRILEAGVNDVLGIVGMGSKDAATLGELRVMSKQVHKALGKAGSDMLRSWQMDDRVVEEEVLALGKQMEFSGIGADYFSKAMGGKLGSIMRGISFRHMTASDEFLKSFHSHIEVAAHAYRMAKAEGLKGDAMESRIEELMKYGSPAWQRAYNSAEWVTFQTRPDQSDRRAISFLDRFAKGIRRFAQTDTGRTKEIVKIDKDGKLRKEVVPIMKPNAFSFFFPFINTPLNIFKIGIEMSPIGAFFSLVDATRALKERMDKGHLTPEAAKAAAAELYDKQRLVQDITNQLIGAGMFWALGTLVKPDDDDELPFITGSVDWKRTSRGDRDVRAKVMPAYSIRIGDAIFSYQRVEPFGTALAFLVDMRLAVEKHGGINDAALGEFMTTAINQLDNKTYLQGVSDLFNLVHDPSRVGTKIAGNLTTGFIPNLIRQPIREADPYIRDTSPSAEDGFMEALGKRIGYSLAPGYAPPMLDVWGDPLLRNPGAKLLGSPITDIPLRVLDPTHLTIGKDTKAIDRYIYNWNTYQADQKERFNIEPIRDTLTIHRNGITHKVAISTEDHLQANRNAGQAARAVLGDDWNPVQPTEQGIERIKDVVRTFQKRERDRLRAKYATTLPVE